MTMFHATQARVIKYGEAIGAQAGGIDERTADVACALLTLLRDEEDPAAPLLAWAEGAQSLNVLAIEGSRLAYAWHDGTRAAGRAWAVDEVSSVEVVEMSDAFPEPGTGYFGWDVTKWRVALRDGTRIEPTVSARGASEVLKGLVQHLAP